MSTERIRILQFAKEFLNEEHFCISYNTSAKRHLMKSTGKKIQKNKRRNIFTL